MAIICDAVLDCYVATFFRSNDANLRRADLTGAYALVADFGGATLDGAVLDGVYDQATTWPPGVRPPRPDR